MLTIGEFSKLSHISSRMLRYYDGMGLLCPAHTGQDNGYRYYDVSQLQTLLKIENLKEYGFTLSEMTCCRCHRKSLRSKFIIADSRLTKN